MSGVRVWRWVAAESRRAVLLDAIEWTVNQGEHWVLLGPNGAGKTTLLNLAAAASHPSEGTVHVLGSRLGAVDMRALRERIGTVEPGLARRLQGRSTAQEIVLTGAYGSIALQSKRIEPADLERAEALIATVGATPLRDRRYENCSQGERQRLLLARALMDEPELLLARRADHRARPALARAPDRLARRDGRLPPRAAERHRHPPPRGDPRQRQPRPAALRRQDRRRRPDRAGAERGLGLGGLRDRGLALEPSRPLERDGRQRRRLARIWRGRRPPPPRPSEIPPAGFEPATIGLEVRRSVH
jgi:iron complex transport system ATP-binding protein